MLGSIEIVTPIAITLLVTLPIIAFGTWLHLHHPKLWPRVHTARSISATMASLACGIPCCLVALYALSLLFIFKHSEETFELLMMLFWLWPWASPVAVAGLIFAAFASKSRRLCLCLNAAYFVTWAAFYLFG